MQENELSMEVLESGALESGALESMERASIDVQISTAKKYPRQLSVVKGKMLTFATLDIETAQGCFYTLPARRGGDGKPLQGPSIRMAEIALATYGNVRAGARVIADDGKVITAQGVCHDLENNVFISVEVKRRVTDKSGKRYSDDMVVTTGNAACSIALRNATFRVVPLALVKPVYEAAKRTAIGDAKTLTGRRADALNAFKKMGIESARVFAALNVKSIEDIGLEQLEVLIGYYNSIKDGEAKIDEIFPAANQIPTSVKPPEEAKKEEAKKAETAEEAAAGLAPSEPSKPEKKPEVKQPEPAAPATPPSAPSTPSPALAQLRAALSEHGVPEIKALSYMQKKFRMAQTSFEAMNESAPRKIAQLIESLSAWKEEILAN